MICASLASSRRSLKVFRSGNPWKVTPLVASSRSFLYSFSYSKPVMKEWLLMEDFVANEISVFLFYILLLEDFLANKRSVFSFCRFWLEDFFWRLYNWLIFSGCELWLVELRAKNAILFSSTAFDCCSLVHFIIDFLE